jgi:transposase-like protein
VGVPLRQFQLNAAVPENLASWIHDRAKRLVEALLEAEVSEVLGRASYQRDTDIEEMSKVSRNGYKLRWLKVGDSKLKMRLPQLRGTEEPFRSCLWHMLKGQCPKLDGFVLSLYADGPSSKLIRQFMDCLDCEGEEQPLGEDAIRTAMNTLREDFEHHARRDLSKVVPVCLSVGTLSVRIPQPASVGIEQSFLVCFAKCGNGAEEVLSVSAVDGLDDARVLDRVDELKDRGLPPPLLLGGVASPAIRSRVSKLYSASQRRSYWEELLRNRRFLVSADVMPLAKAGWGELE